MLLTDLGIYSRAALQVATQPLIAVGNAWRGSRARRAA
jgi:hypothetical protein